MDVRIANLLLGTMFAIAAIALLMGDSSMMDRSPLLFGFMVLFSVFFAARHFTSAVMVHRDMKREDRYLLVNLEVQEVLLNSLIWL